MSPADLASVPDGERNRAITRVERLAADAERRPTALSVRLAAAYKQHLAEALAERRRRGTAGHHVSER